MVAKKYKKDYNNLKLILSVLFIALLVIALLQWRHSKRIRFIHYDAFGIDVPIAYKIHGIDVSRYQKKIEWEGVSLMSSEGIKINFVFMKATEGSTITDPYFKYNWDRARKKKIIRGAYHFFNPKTDPKAQANYFISKVKLQNGDLPPVLDVETIGNTKPEDLKSDLKIWLNQVEAFYKVKPIIYTNADFYKKYLGEDFDDYHLWVAHYYEKQKPRISRQWTFWQHNDRGRVSGIRARVDFNVFNGDSVAFQNILLPQLSSSDTIGVKRQSQ